VVSGDTGEAIHLNSAIANKLNFLFQIATSKFQCNGYHEV
jgi:hypothetical protein